MKETLQQLSWAFTKWRAQVFHLAVNVMRQATHGSALGWVWAFAKPGFYIVCFWFALNIGLKAARVSSLDNVTYMIWLAGGIIPWFYIRTMLGTGTNVFRKYSYLVKRLKFPVPLIPVFYQLGELFIHLMLLVFLLVGYFLAGGTLDLYLLQLVFLVLVMYILSVSWSLFASSMSAISKDFLNLIKALSTPIFWLSGILYDINAVAVDIPVLRTVLYFNPVTFIVSGYRQCLVCAPGYKTWLWEDPAFFWIGIGMVVLTAIAGLCTYAHLRKDIPDVI